MPRPPHPRHPPRHQKRYALHQHTTHAPRCLGFALRRLSHERLVIDPAALSQYVTLLFIGTISALSIRAFLRNASRIFSTLTAWRGWFGLGGGGGGGSAAQQRRLPGGGSGGASLVLLLAEVTGVYSISSLLLIRRNVPVAKRDVIDAVLGGELEFQYFHRWGLCACCAALSRVCLQRARPCCRRPPPGAPDARPPHRWFNGLFIASALVTACAYYGHYKAGAAEQMESLLPTTHKTAAYKA